MPSKKKSERIKPVTRMAHNAERESASELGKCLTELDKQQNQLQKLIDYRDDYNRRLQSSAQQGMESARLLEYRTFINNINQAIEQQQKHLVELQRQCDAKRKVWIDKHKKVQVFDKIGQKFQQQENDQEARHEQKLMDELAQQRHR